jgi:hypothetical protein
MGFLLQNQRQKGRTGFVGREVVKGVGGLAPVGGGRWLGRGSRINMMQTVYTHVCKCKNDTC